MCRRFFTTFAGALKLHAQFHDWPYFDGPVNLEDWAALGKLHGLLQITSLDQCVPTDDVFGLGEWSVRHRLLLAFHQLARSFKGLALVFHMTFLTKLLEPGHPLLHHLLRPLRGSSALPTTI